MPKWKDPKKQEPKYVAPITGKNPNALANALKDYFKVEGTSSAHVYHNAVESGKYTYQELEKLGLPEHAVTLLQAYADATTVGRKGISLEIDTPTRLRTIALLAERENVNAPQKYKDALKLAA